MTAPDSHPSFLALDRAALGEASAEVKAHLAQCPRCAEHVATVSRPAPVPTWVSELANEPPPRATRGWLRGLALATCGALAVAILVLALPDLAPNGTPASWPQGGSSEVLLGNPSGGNTPAVTLSVQRGAALQPWDGRSPVQAGDELRLRVVTPEGFSHVTVAVADGSTWRVLSAQPVQPGRPLQLPTESRWEVRGDGESERLLVVFSNGPVDLAQASQWHAGPQRTPSLWTLAFTLPIRQP